MGLMGLLALAGKCCKHLALLVNHRKKLLTLSCYLPLVTYCSLNMGRLRAGKFDLVPQDGAQRCLSNDCLLGCVVNIWVDLQFGL